MVKMRKAVFFDIDGTVWDDGQRIPDSAREAFRLMKERGHFLFISSGRTRVFIPDRDLMPLGFDGILAGCGTYGEFQGEEKFHYQIELGQMQRLNEFLRDLGAAYIFEGRDYLYFDAERFPEESPFTWGLQETLGEKVLRVTGNEGSLAVSKFCVNCFEDAKRQAALEKELGKAYTVIHREGNFVEVVPRGCSKAEGIRKICELLGIAHEDTYSFGDSTNDVDMLRYTAHSVAMGNGMRQAKEAAEYVTAPLWEDGLYEGCRHFGLL